MMDIPFKNGDIPDGSYSKIEHIAKLLPEMMEDSIGKSEVKNCRENYLEHII